MILREAPKISIILKRCVVVLLLCAIIISPSIAMAQKKNSGTILILGDSIATGYGLAGYNCYYKPKAETSWSSMLSKRYSANKYNLAVDGDTTSNLIERITDPYTQWVVSQADVICLSIGGNNFLKALSHYADNILSIANLEQDAKRVINEAACDLDIIFEKFKQQNPNATILVQTLYNPYQYWTIQFPDGRTWGDVLGSYIDSYNSMLKEKIRANGFVCVDVAEKFKTEDSSSWLYTQLTYENFLDVFKNIANIDPHPTAEGHYAIFEAYINTADALLSDRLSKKIEDSATISSATEQTDATNSAISSVISQTNATNSAISSVTEQTGTTNSVISSVTEQTGTTNSVISSTTGKTDTTSSVISSTTGQTGTVSTAEPKNTDEKVNRFYNSFAWWHYLLLMIALCLGISGLIILFYIIRKKGQRAN